MIDIQSLIDIDRMATLALNGSDSLYLDSVSNLYTTIWVWIPLALAAVYLIIRNVESRYLIPILILIVLTVVICDQVSSHFAKPFFARFRPSRDLSMLHQIDTVGGYHGLLYGFFSGHAANSFGIAVLLMWIVRDWWFGLSVGIWATVNSLIRVYLGVHFVGDILVGAAFGTLTGTLLYWLFRLYSKGKLLSPVCVDRYSNIFTSSGFKREDIFLFLSFLFGTGIFILIFACLRQLL